MKKADAIKHFGTQRNLAKRLGIKPPSISDWGDVVPFARQQQLEDLTGGALRAMTWKKFIASRRVRVNRGRKARRGNRKSVSVV